MRSHRWFGFLSLVILLAVVAGADNKQDSPKPVSLADAPRISKETRMNLIRAFNAELVYVRTPFPMGNKGLRLENGKVTPSGHELEMMVATYGPAAKPGDMARITNIMVKDRSIRFEINGGPVKKKKWYQRIEVGGMVLSDDDGKNWQPANEGLTDMDIHEVLASREHSGMVFLACGEACFRSHDRAGHWENISPKTHDYGISVAEDKNGVVYVGAAKGRPNLWIREQGALAAIFRSRDKGSSWEKVIDNLNGGVMHMCPTPDGNGMVAGTSDGALLVIDDFGAREVVSGLPFVTAVELGA